MKNQPEPASQRLVSLDALRGFDMCWILGLGEVMNALLIGVPGQMSRGISSQLEHVDWAGFRAFDLIFPLFLFVAGASMAIALPRRLMRESKLKVARHLIVRAMILFALGLLYSGGLENGWEKVRWLGVLQRIGIASAAAGLLSLCLGWRGLTVTVISLLGAYYALLSLVHVPGIGAGDFTEGRNFTNYIDSIWLPGSKYDGDHDPEGLLSTLPAIVTALIGLLAGKWITSAAPAKHKVVGLIAVGVVMIALGWLWHPFFPVIKKIWSSSFVLVAGGWSAVLLGVFYWLVDVRGWQSWTPPFIWVGANSILLYVCSGLGIFHTITQRLTGHPDQAPAWLSPFVMFSLMLLLARWLWQRRIFIKV